jgi:signal transduction histidine kinase
MAREGFRQRLGFALAGAGVVTLATAAPAISQGLGAASLISAAPLAIALGVGGFGLLGLMVVRTMLREGRQAQQRAQGQIATLRALLDDYEALLSGSGEITIVWSNRNAGPKYFGAASAVLSPGRRMEAILDFGSWLDTADAEKLGTAVKTLRSGGQGFDMAARALDRREVRLIGRSLGAGAVLRLVPTSGAIGAAAKPDIEARKRAETFLSHWPEPALLLEGGGKAGFTNSAYQALARGRSATPREIADAAGMEIVEFALPSGRAAVLRPRALPLQRPREEGLAHLGAIIDAVALPIAIFDAARELVQSNHAYAALWGLDPNWLRPGLDERAILDRLRTMGMLPMEPDYQAWRARHLQSYSLKAPRESEPWYLPDGRTIQVISAPAGPNGGVIYVFEDISDQLRMKSQHQTQIDVQRSTLNALTEGVAVFGTNGKLTLSNPRLSILWKLPVNLLQSNPHIDEIIDTVGRALPEDGSRLWRELKRGIVDLNPTRTDTSGRIVRADARMLDYAITRLPDGQTMMTFVDVTESASYQRMLTERNEALVTADRLKDAFVQNVSYELRSPLTNIIGFADLLATGTAGPLNAKQTDYTNYIRASSAQLGVLIDNILDLATVDAGIAELRPELQDVPALIEKARAGLVATFPAIDGAGPLNLSVVIPEELPPLLADGTRVVQILYNLLSTAARFTEPGGLVTLTVVERGGRMLFTIEDEGTKTSEQMRAALNAETVPGRQRGAGLGLAIVRSFVSMHGGTVSVERREPRGSRVVVSLPLTAAYSTAAE